MRHPCAVVAFSRLAQFVGAHLVQSRLIGCGVIANRYLRRHPAHGMRPAAMTNFDDMQRIIAHERHRHGHLRAIRQQIIGVIAQLLDVAENIIPASAIQPGRMLAQFVQDLFRFEDRQDGLDQHCRFDRALRNAQRVLGVDKDIVPQTRFKMVFQLRQVKVRSSAALHCRADIVKEIQAKVEQAAGYRRAIDAEVALVQMPAARTRQQGRRFVIQLIEAPVGVFEGDAAVDSVAQVDLPQKHILPAGGVGVFKVRHEDFGAAIQGVDDHLALGRSRDLDAAVLQIWRDRGDAPVHIVADMRRFRQEVRQLSGVDGGLSLYAGAQQLVAAGGESAGEVSEEIDGVGREDGGEFGRDGAADIDALAGKISHG